MHKPPLFTTCDVSLSRLLALDRMSHTDVKIAVSKALTNHYHSVGVMVSRVADKNNYK